MDHLNTYSVIFLVPEDIGTDTKFMSVSCLEVKLCKKREMAAILDAILDFQVCTRGIPGDF